MWLAKSVCIYKPWCLLCCGNSFSNPICFHPPYWGHGESLFFFCVRLSFIYFFMSLNLHTEMKIISRGFGWELYVDSLFKG